MRRWIFFFTLAILAVGLAKPTQAQQIGCCIAPGIVCLDGFSQSQCDETYATHVAPNDRYFPTACSEVSLCEIGKCEKTGDATQCSNGIRLSCNELNDPTFQFYAGGQCGAAPASGTCCVEQPAPQSGLPSCTPNVDKTTCQNQGYAYKTQSCTTILNCPQYSSNNPVGTITAPEIKLNPIEFKPEVPLPNFLGGPISADTFAQYIRAIFIYFIGLVGVLAVVMVIYGGVKWVAAAGNPSRINDARDQINNAIIGVIIALTSIVLLNLINPRLTIFSGLTLVGVKSEPFALDSAPGLYGEATTQGGCTTARSHKTIQPETSCVLGDVNLTWPVDSSAPRAITSRVGLRSVAGASGASPCHPGTDFSVGGKTGVAIRAMTNGTISLPNKVCSEATILLNAGTFTLYYLHISQLNVTNGQTVKAGDVIGYSGGSTAVAGNCSTAPHSHIELHTSDQELHDLAACVK